MKDKLCRKLILDQDQITSRFTAKMVHDYTYTLTSRDLPGISEANFTKSKRKRIGPFWTNFFENDHLSSRWVEKDSVGEILSVSLRSRKWSKSQNGDQTLTSRDLPGISEANRQNLNGSELVRFGQTFF